MAWSGLLRFAGAAPLVAALCVSAASQGWDLVPGILRRIRPPVFPSRTFDITRYGAKSGEADNTAAIAKTVKECSLSGGGRVVVPEGKFRTGPVHLTNNVELHLAKGAELIFSDKPEDYLPPVLVRVGGVELNNYSPLIYARDCTNVAVTGSGRLNGNATNWWSWKSRETKTIFQLQPRGTPVEKRIFGTPEAAIRPSFLSFVSCTNVLLQDFEIGSGPNWTIHPVYCQNVTIRGVRVITDGPNNDGIDPDSCRDVLIEKCVFDTGDDCVVLKSGYNEDGWRVGRATENVVMRRCEVLRGHGGLVIGSEMSGDVRNVFVHDCKFDGTDRAIRIKSRGDRGGVVEHVYGRALSGANLTREAIILNMDYTADRNALKSGKAPVFRNMHFEDIKADGAPAAVLITGLEESPISNLRFSKLNIQSVKGVSASHVSNIVFEDSEFKTSAPVFAITNGADIRLTRIRAGDAEPFLFLTGEKSGTIKIQQCGLENMKQPVKTTPGISTESVEVAK